METPVAEDVPQTGGLALDVRYLGAPGWKHPSIVAQPGHRQGAVGIPFGRVSRDLG